MAFDVTPHERAARAEIQAILAENAELLGEPLELEIRRPGKDWVRIQLIRDGRPVRGQYREYLGWAGALRAGRQANQRARAFVAKP